MHDGVINKPDLDYLAHYGVKGMKWGVRKKQETNDNKEKTSHIKQILSSRKTKAVIVTAAAVAVVAVCAKMKVNRVMKNRRQNQLLFNNLMRQIDNFPTMSTASNPLVLRTSPPTSTRSVLNTSARSFVSSTRNSSNLDAMLDGLNNDMLNNIQNMLNQQRW